MNIGMLADRSMCILGLIFEREMLTEAEIRICSAAPASRGLPCVNSAAGAAMPCSTGRRPSALWTSGALQNGRRRRLQRG